MACSGLLDMPCVIGHPNSQPLIRAPPFCYTLCPVYVPNISGKSLSFDTRPIRNRYGVIDPEHTTHTHLEIGS
jgi:hypothetical protein